MATEKIIKTRIMNKHGDFADWEKATNFIPKAGEIIVYDDLEEFKVGDGITPISKLDFFCKKSQIEDANKNDPQSDILKLQITHGKKETLVSSYNIDSQTMFLSFGL